MPTQNSKHFYHFSEKDMLAMTKMKFALLTDFRISQPSASRIPPSRCQDNAQGPRKRQLWQLPAVASTWPGPKFTATQLHTTSRCGCCHIVETWWKLHCHILYFSLEKFRKSLEVDSDFAVYSDFWEDCLSAITCCSSGNTITWRFGRQLENVRTCWKHSENLPFSKGWKPSSALKVTSVAKWSGPNAWRPPHTRPMLPACKRCECSLSGRMRSSPYPCSLSHSQCIGFSGLRNNFGSKQFAQHASTHCLTDCANWWSASDSSETLNIW